jgi:hypothetical protein
VKRFTESALRHAGRPNPLLSLVEEGYTPEQIKQGIIEALTPFFSNRDVLEEHAIETLAGEVVNLAFVRSDPRALSVFDHARELYAQAHLADAAAAHRCCAFFEPHVEAGVAEFWSLLYLEVPKADLDLPEFKHEVFRHIGAMLEACVQPFLREMLGMLRIRRGKIVTESDLAGLPLGNVVAELADVTRREDIYSPQPWGIRLNQWRNVAQHYRATTAGERVRVVFGEGNAAKHLELTRDELNDVLKLVAAYYRAVKLARTLFFVDNIRAIVLHLTDTRPRTESVLFAFVASVATQGFNVVDVRASETALEVWLQDLTPEEQPKRLIHASQLVYPLWARTDAAIVRVHYARSADDAVTTFTATAEDCLALTDQRISMAEFVDRVIGSAGELPEYARRPTHRTLLPHPPTR